MAKISLAGFKDPVRRPRYIIWTGVAVMVLAAFVVVAFGATSTYWFCAEVCHKVQDDSIAAYDRSSHNMVSCMSCHEPVNADPITFTLKKAKALGELVLTVTNNYELPLNPESHLALNSEEMGSDQCTQCHSENRVITPSDGIIIDHAVHADKEVQCTACHNRIAHNESGDWEPVLSNPNDGPMSVKHANFMSMTACFRCHTLTSESPSGAEYKAPGKCSACHPKDFDLKPANHDDKGFYPEGHAVLAMTPIDPSTGKPDVDAEAAEAEEAEGEAHEGEEAEGEAHALELASVEAIDYCSTC
ncbi:MAG: NapC/NirT family cytochrome c, partial [Coriobacteriia bacterium]|nr:NapC/NirT family cytochrome c [Coriobacteriia bacterium]